MSESEQILLALSGIFVLGMGGQWVASLLRIPSILVLLATGIIVGPVFKLIQPDALLGDLILPIVSLCVAIILFEGSLGLQIKQLKEIGRPLFMLLSVGVLITWAICTVAAVFVLNFELPIALLLGSILTVTGPTVVGPMLSHIRPTGKVGPIARWEGIVVDPIGAVLAVLVFQAFEYVHNEDYSGAVWVGAAGYLTTIGLGIVIGTVAALFIAFLFRRHLVSDHLQSPFALMVVVAVFALSNLVAHESGLVTVTVMGIVLANQRSVSIRHIIEFKENLSVLLISTLFILLAARLDLADFQELGWRGIAFAAIVILIARPVSVLISTIGSDLSFAERGFLSWLAPRGIVAAAVASVFALELGEGNDFVAETFLVIISTVLVYGATSGWVARKLGLSVPNPQGLLIAGADDFARAVGSQLHNLGVTVCLVDRNAQNIRKARMDGMPTFYADILSEAVHEDIDLGGIGRFLSLLPNDEVNSLAAEHCGEVFGRANVYRLPAVSEGSARTSASSSVHTGRELFSQTATHGFLTAQLEAGAQIKATTLSDEFGWDDFVSEYGEDALVLFRIQNGSVQVADADQSAKSTSGQTIVALVNAPAAV
ncbi:MAG: cation:proton antiporter [Planctomycetaceae bacterium]